MTWITLTLIVPLAMMEALSGLVSPGGGLVVVKNGGETAMVDMVTRKESAETVKTLCAKSGSCKVVGAWTPDGEPAGSKYDALDEKVARTEASKLVEADAPFDLSSYVSKLGNDKDVHRFAGQGERVKTAVGEKPPLVVKNGGTTGMVDIITSKDSVVEPPAPFRYLLK